MGSNLGVGSVYDPPRNVPYFVFRHGQIHVHLSLTTVRRGNTRKYSTHERDHKQWRDPRQPSYASPRLLRTAVSGTRCEGMCMDLRLFKVVSR